MTIAPGSRLGGYEITGRLGEGGMGEVWRARDTKLGREAAIKVLPPGFAADADRVARFRREAQILASLGHSGIAAIYGLEESDGTLALAMELVPGEDLSERLARGPLVLEDALAVARQIAEALEEAHGKGIVHRDLKPANVKLTPDGKVKVLDFGLAKAFEAEPGKSGLSSDSSRSPTMTGRATQAGMILGTAAYMSPEQARGKPVDKRADVWSFGVVLFEMLTGRRLFAGETVSDTLAAVLRADPEWALLPPATPAPLSDLLRRCLERDPHRRLHDVADARLVLEDLLEGRGPVSPATAPPAAPVASAARQWTRRVAVFLLGALAMTPILWSSRRDPAPAAEPSQPTSFRQLTFLAGGEMAPALSPDGETFAYVKDVGGQRDVFLQRVGGTNPVNLTAGCKADDDEPAFSPDGRRIAYRSECAGGGIFVMGATGESARKVTDKGYNPAWSPDGRELAIAGEKLRSPFARITTSPLWAVKLETGERRIVSSHDAVEPSWSPDGKRIAFWGLDDATSARDLYTVAADGSQSEPAAAVRLLSDPHVDWSPNWSGDGRSLFFASSRGGTMNLWRIDLDPGTGRSRGAPEPITAPSSWAGYLTASADGRRIAFVDRNVRATVRIAPFDPAAGKIAGSPREAPLGTVEANGPVSLSPDGATLLFDDSGFPQRLVLVDPGGAMRQLTEGTHRDRQGAFSPDGAWIAFQTDRWPGKLALVRPDGSGLSEVLPGRTTSVFNPFWSPDGRWLGAGNTDADGPFLIEIADGKAVGSPQFLAPLGEAGLDFWPSSFSPDGRRIAGAIYSAAANPVGGAVYSLGDRSYRRVPTGDSSALLFLPDGRRLLLVSSRSIRLFDLETGGVRTLVTAPEGGEIGSAALSRDGRHLAWQESTDESDIWLAEFERKK
ncbi:MAG: protein kinase [Thermoanaerobaculia bacterium]